MRLSWANSSFMCLHQTGSWLRIDADQSRGILQVTTKKAAPIPPPGANQTPLICHLSSSSPTYSHTLLGIGILLVMCARNRESCTASRWPDKFLGTRRAVLDGSAVDATRPHLAPGERSVATRPDLTRGALPKPVARIAGSVDFRIARRKFIVYRPFRLSTACFTANINKLTAD